jgi:hypothetical protein
MATSLSCWAAQQRRGNTPFALERYATPHDEAASQVGNGENYPSFDSPDRGVASPILGVGKKQSRRTQMSGLIHYI